MGLAARLSTTARRREDLMRHARDYDDSNRVALAALTGAMVGAGVALLSAPKPGAQLRGGIRGSVGEWQGKVSRSYQDLSERATAAIEQVHGAAGRAVAAVEHGVNHYKSATTRPQHIPPPDA
jgi:gas vesicle protein